VVFIKFEKIPRVEPGQLEWKRGPHLCAMPPLIIIAINFAFDLLAENAKIEIFFSSYHQRHLAAQVLAGESFAN